MSVQTPERDHYELIACQECGSPDELQDCEVCGLVVCNPHWEKRGCICACYGAAARESRLVQMEQRVRELEGTASLEANRTALKRILEGAGLRPVSYNVVDGIHGVTYEQAAGGPNFITMISAPTFGELASAITERLLRAELADARLRIAELEVALANASRTKGGR